LKQTIWTFMMVCLRMRNLTAGFPVSVIFRTVDHRNIRDAGSVRIMRFHSPYGVTWSQSLQA
ncbi:MAG: hypothetical protein WB554_03245, partial [Desulfomonilaceae bacterium]